MRRSVGWHFAYSAFCMAALLVVVLHPAAQAMPTPANSFTDADLVVHTPHYELAGSGISVPGYAAETAPGHPILPVYGTLVELPSTGNWEVAYQAVGSRVLDQRVALPSVPVPAPSFDGPESWTLWPEEAFSAAAPVVERPDPAVYGTDAFHPASLVAAGEVVWQDGVRLLPLRVYPFQYNPVAGLLRYHPEIRIQVKITGASDAVQAESVGAAAPDAIVAAPQALSGSGGTLRIRTAAAGMYRLTYNELIAKGVPADASTAGFAMTYLGLPVDIHVLDANSNGLFNNGDLVIFYAEAANDRYNKNNVYFLSYGGAGGGRMALRYATPENAPVLTTVIRTTRVEKDTAYYSSYPIAPTADHFFDGPITVSTSTPVSTLTYTLSLVDPVTTENVAFRGRFYGGQDQGANPDQSLQVLLNGQALGTFQWQGRTGYDALATAPATSLSTTSNALAFQAALAQLPGLTGYWAYVDWVELDYPSQATAQGDRLAIKGLDVAGTAAEVRTTGFSTRQVTVYDVRDPRHPALIGNTASVGASAPYGLTFWDTWPTGAPPPSYFLAAQAGLIAPAAIEVAPLPAWNTPANTYDYIAIVHSSLAAAIQPLLDHRAAASLRVAKVDVQDIYDLYSGGLVNPEAIRSFLSYAYHNWNAGGPRPRYVLLVGDGHYDFKNVTNTPQLNLIPPYLVPVDPWLGETAADNRYVSFDGPDDFMPEMAIGRIPAQTAAEVTAAVNKILAYENPSLTPDGAWQNMVTFVADRANDPAGNFQAISDEVRLNWLPTTYNNRHIYWQTDYTVAYPNMNDAIKVAFNDSIMLQWFGHASRFLWGSTQVFSFYSVPNIPTGATSTQQQWPFSIDYSCWTGYFMNLFNSGGYYRTVGEALLLTPGKGSVAVLAPSGQHVGSALLILNQVLVKSVFQDRILPVGDAVNAAKSYYYANASAWYDVIDTSVLFGDPAMPLRLPAPPATPTPTATPVTPTATPTNTPVPPTITPTATPVTPTVATPTATRTPRKVTATPVVATATPTRTATPTAVGPTATPTVTPAAGSILHVGDLGISKATVKNGWTATVTILVHDQNHAAVGGATVSGSWSGPYTGTSSCTTNTDGACSVTVTIRKAGTETFTVTNLARAGYGYAPSSNHVTSVSIAGP